MMFILRIYIFANTAKILITTILFSNEESSPPLFILNMPPAEVPVILLLVRVVEVSDTVEGWLLVTAAAVSEACSEVDGFELLMKLCGL